MKKNIFQSIIFLSLLMVLSIPVFSQKLKVEEILNKNLESIGTRQKRESLKNLFAIGLSQFASTLPEKKTGGKIVMVSDHNNFYYLSGFNSKEYPFEKIGYFDGKVNLPFVTAGARSPLGAFIADHQRILTDSLFAGAMSMRWTLDKGKFVASGTKKINDRKVYVVEYFPNVGSQEFTVKLYFDAENFHHLRTEYNHTIANKENKFGTFGVQSGITITMSEDFDEFKTADDLTLPYSYKIKYLTDSDQGVHSYEWKVNISQYLLDRNLDAKFFTFDSK